MAIQVYKFHADPTGKSYVTNVGGIWRGIADPNLIPEELKTNAPMTSDETYRGTSGGAMSYGDLVAHQASVDAQAQLRATPTATPAPATNPNAFRPRMESENMTAYLQAKQAYEMQTTGTSTVNLGAPQSQPAPIAPQAPVSPVPTAPVTQQPQTPQTSATGQKQYVKYAGSPDTFDRSGRYISAQEAAGIPNFFQQVEEIAAPRPDVKVESDFAKLAGQNISQMVKEATAPTQPTQPIQPVQPPQPQPAQPTTGAMTAQKPYVQYEGSPDVFERATGKYISAEEAEKIPDFFSQVEKATSVRPGITTEEDFAKVAKTNLQLQQSGATTTSQDFQNNPLKAFQDTYSQIWNNLGLNSVKEQIETTLKAMKGVDNEMIDKIAEVNDNPWISEAERSRQVIKLQGKYEQKNKANTENLKLLQGLFETGQKEAQFVSSNALDVYYKERTFDENEKLKAMDIAEKMSVAMNKKSFRDLVGPDGRMHTYIVNEAGEKLADLGVSEIPKVTGGGTTETPEVIFDKSGTPLEFGTPEYVIERLKQTAGSKTKPVASEREQLGKFANVVALTDNLMNSLNKTTNDPIVGYLRSLNPYDFDARVVNAQVTALVPSVARALYGEVGVLTDTDIERYLKTLPNIKSTAQQNKFIAAMTLANAKRAYEQTLLNLASSQLNVSGFVDSYKNMTEKLKKIESELGTGKEVADTSQMSNQEFLKNIPTFGPPAPTQTDNKSFFGNIYNWLTGK